MRPPFATSRRQFIQRSVKAAGAIALTSNWPWALARASLRPADPVNPRFFIQLFYKGGLDPLFLFDARPLSLTAAGLQQNYLGEEPQAWAGDNGQSTLTTRMTNPLREWRADFSVINGVIMSSAFDGHTQNTNFLFTGNAFGGDYFAPHLNLNNQFPLDGVSLGSFPTDLVISNGAATIPLTFETARTIVEHSGPESAVSGALAGFADRFLEGREQALAAGSSGAFTTDVRRFLQARRNLPALKRAFAQVQVPPPTSTEADPFAAQIDLVLSGFRAGVARTSLLFGDLGGEVDCHVLADARRHPHLCELAARQIATLIRRLKTTPFDATRSMFDVTVFCVASEFGRSMRQDTVPFSQTGTNHNPFGNSVIIGGAGLRGGRVVGATDFLGVSETLSPAHLSLDATRLKRFGRPFDFATQSVRMDLPATFRLQDYIGYPSVMNTLYTSLGVPDVHFRLIDANGPKAPVLRTLLV